MSNSRKIASLPNVLTLLDDAGGEFLAQQAAATTTSYTVTWPEAVGGSGALLGTTNSAGAMGWLTALSGLTINNSVIGGSTPAAITGTTVTATSSFVGDITGDITGNADTATTLATPRTFSITGDGTSTFTSFDGSANVSGALTLATVNSNVGSFGSTTSIPVVTVNAKGLVTAVSTASISSTLTVAADSGSDDTITVGTDTLTFAGTANEIETTVSDNQIQFGLSSTLQSTTQSPGDNSTKVATTAYVDSATAALVDSAPSTLDTLNELAAALGDDANFSTTITNSVAAKLPLAGGTMTGDIELDDNVKVSFGDSQDLQIYHVPNAVAGLVRNNVDIAAGGIEFNITQGGFGVNIGSNDMMSIGTGGTSFYSHVSSEKFLASGTGNDHGLDFGTSDKLLPWHSTTHDNIDDTVDLGSSSYRWRQIHGVQLFGTVQTAAQPNITSLGTLTGLTVSSTISGSVSGSAGSAGTAATVTGSSQTAITSVGTLSSLAVSGDVTVDTNTLKVDTSNNRVGILNASPDVTLDVGSATDAVHMPVGTTAQRPSSPAAGYIRYNSDTGGFEGYTDSWGEIGGGGGSNTFTKDSFSGDGSTTAFALSQTTGSEDNLIAFIDGVFQTQSAYSIVTASGTTTLTFSVAPPNGTEIIVYSVASAVSGANLNLDTMTGDGSTVAMSLSISAVNENNTQVYFDGVYQSKANYSISGTTLTFSTAPATGVEVEVMTMTQTEINVPVDNTVTAAKLTSDSVTTAKILDDNVTAAKLEHDINLVGNPTTTTQSASDNSTKIATTAYVETAAAAAAAAVVDAAPSTLDTLNELAAALGDDPNFATTVTNSIAAKAPLANPTFTGTTNLDVVDIDGAVDMASTLNIGTGSGTSASAGFDEFVIEGGNADIGMAFLSPAANDRTQTIAFGDSNNNASGKISYNHSTDSMAFRAAGGSDAITVNSSGNVGIGLSSGISSKLHVNAEMSLGADADNRAILGYASNAFTIGTRESSTNYFSTVAVTGGSVGIGTSSINSDSILHLKSTQPNIFFEDTDDSKSWRLEAGSVFKLQNVTTSSEVFRFDQSGDLILAANATGAALIKGVSGDQTDRNTGGYPQFTFVGNEGTGIRRASANVLAFDTGGAEAVRIDSSGNVGIGTAGPEYLLTLEDSTPTITLNHTTSWPAANAELGRIYFATDWNGVGAKIKGESDGQWGNTDYPGRLTFWTTPDAASDAVERMRISSSGNLLVGTTSSVGSSPAKLEILGATGGGRCINTKVTVDTSANHITFHNGNGQVGYINTNGSATAYNTSSDQRLKDNIQDAEDAGELIDAIQVRQFDWKADGSHQRFGMVAQELTTVAPEAVSTPEDPDEMMGVDYSKLVPMLIKEIQTLRTRLAQLENN